jgi:(hydroxyamino)benzene mutase
MGRSKKCSTKARYSGFAIVAAFLLAAFWGAGNSTMPLAAGSARGTVFQESTIRAVAYSSAPTGVISFAMILWGLRIAKSEPS